MITDKEIIQHGIDVFGFLIPHKIRVYTTVQLAEAIEQVYDMDNLRTYCIVEHLQKVDIVVRRTI